ncbi:bromodomain adjacent to zinc finger domain protein 1A-like [Pocillopora damicornis]|nr:bromodomain adjacent to zinc finger domain protein 1A-like [Pocillopora damicornis]
MFHLDNKGSEEAKQRWLDAVNKATTVSRCHLLLGILASLVIWDMSAEHARCKICGRKDIGKTLILCDHCNQGYHLHCLRPALSKAPEGDWSCPVCKPNERVSSRTGTKNYKQESGSEIEDSKDEASEASLNSCDENEDYCYTCGEDGDLICCDTCPLVFHKTCHQPPLRNIPRGAWSCWFCRQPKDQKSVKVRKSEKSVKAKGKAKKLLKRMGSFVRESEQKQPHMRIKTASKRIFQKHARDGRKRARDARARAVSRARPSLEDISDEESIDGRGNQKPRRVSRRLQRMYQQVSEDELEENSTRDTNVKSFYGKTNRKVSKREVFSEEDDDLIEERGRNACRKTRAHNRPQISDVSEDEGDDDEDSGKENRKISPFASFQKTTYRSTRNHRKVPSSSEESDESGYTEDSEELNNGRLSRKKGKKNAKNLSVNKAGRKAARKTRRTEESSENSKRRRANVEMDTCEQILRALVRHEDSWPFTQAVNVREVPDYLDLVSTPMDLGTIKGKLNSLEYPDVDSFEADVRLVFSNSDKYNLSTSEVGQAGKKLEQYFDKIFEENFSSKDRKSKIHRKR